MAGSEVEQNTSVQTTSAPQVITTELSHTDMADKSDEAYIEVAKRLIDVIYSSNQDVAEEKIRNTLQVSSASPPALTIVASTLGDYVKLGRYATNVTDVLCRAIGLNKLALIDWILSLRCSLDYRAIIEAIGQDGVAVDTARHITYNTAFVPQMCVDAPNASFVFQSSTNAKVALLNGNPVAGFSSESLKEYGSCNHVGSPDGLYRDNYESLPLFKLVKENQCAALKETLSAYPQDQRGLSPYLATHLLTHIAEHFSDDIAVELFEQLQKVSTLYWVKPSDSCVAAITGNKHQLMRALFHVAKANQYLLMYALSNNDVTLDTLTFMLTECRGFYSNIPAHALGSFDHDLAFYARKIQALESVLQYMPQHAMWKNFVLRGFDAGFYDWADKFPQAFTDQALAQFAQSAKGAVEVNSFLVRLLDSNLEHKFSLAEALINNPNVSLGHAGTGSGSGSMVIASFIARLSLCSFYSSTPTEPSDLREILFLLLGNLQKYFKDSGSENHSLISASCSIKGRGFVGLGPILILLIAGQVDLALLLCQNFGCNPNALCQISTVDFHSVSNMPLAKSRVGKSILEIALEDDRISVDTFSRWLTVPGLKLELSTVDSQGRPPKFHQKVFLFIKAIIGAPNKDSYKNLTQKNKVNLQNALLSAFLYSHSNKAWSEVFLEEDLEMLLSAHVFEPLLPIITKFSKPQLVLIHQKFCESNSDDYSKDKTKLFFFLHMATLGSKSLRGFLKTVDKAAKSFMLDSADIHHVLKMVSTRSVARDVENSMYIDTLSALHDDRVPKLLRHKSGEGCTPSSLLNSIECDVLNAIFTYLKGVPDAVRYKCVAQLFSLAGLYSSAADNTVIKNGHDIKMDVVKKNVMGLKDVSAVDLCSSQLASLIDQKLMLICARPRGMSFEGGTPENLIKQVVVTLAFRKLFLILDQVEAMPAGWFNEETCRPVFAVLQDYLSVSKNEVVVTALIECKAMVSNYGAATQAFTLLGGGSDIKELTRLVDQAQKPVVKLAISQSSPRPPSFSMHGDL
jgi:hypothetical protein